MAGRKRSEASRAAILHAALALVRDRGYGRLTADALAAAAGVGKQTIYRWWSSLGEVVLEALREHAGAVATPRTGSLEGDIAALLAGTFRLRRDPRDLPVILKGLMAEAQLDDGFAPRFAQFIAERRAGLRAVVVRHVPAAPRAELEATIDMVFGAMWYRILIGHGALDARFARTLARLAARPYRGRKGRRPAKTSRAKSAAC